MPKPRTIHWTLEFACHCCGGGQTVALTEKSGLADAELDARAGAIEARVRAERQLSPERWELVDAWWLSNEPVPTGAWGWPGLVREMEPKGG